MRRRSGAIQAAELAELGFDKNAVARLVARGVLARLHRGVYVDALSPLTPRARLFAALLALGPSAFLSHRTALALHGVRSLDVRRIEVTVVSAHTPRMRDLFAHRTASEPPAEELRTIDGMRLASASRALVEVAGFEREDELDRLIAELARRRLLNLERIDSAIARRAGVAGVVRLRAALARYRPPRDGPDTDASSLERDFAAWLTAHPEIPSPDRNRNLGPWEIDFYWPAQRLVVETDGEPYHLTPQELERDRVKDAWLQRHGIRVLRVTGFRFDHDRGGILGDLTALLRAA